MVFSTTNLFKGIQCPEGSRCTLTNCIYGHQLQSQPQATQTAAPLIPVTASLQTTPSSNGLHAPVDTVEQQGEPLAKRRRITHDTFADKPLSRAEKIKADLEATRSVKNIGAPPQPHHKPAASELNKQHAPASLSRPVSPPIAGGVRPALKQTSATQASATVSNAVVEPKKPAPVKKESLNPRLLTNAPESHSKRTIFLQHIHKDIVRLNAELRSSSESIQSISPAKLKILALSDQEVIKLALDEEEKAARDQPKVYANVIKNRIAAYRKMKPDAFVDVIKTAFNRGVSKPPEPPKGKPIHTGLTRAQEVAVARHLIVSDQTTLIPHGYIPTPPTASLAAEASLAVQTSLNYEVCDRCSARFRVFPDRNSEGKLTTNGPCAHHPRRKVFPTKQKTDAYTGGSQPYYPCCMEPVDAGSAGCTTSEDHVFKTSSPARLAAVLPFITTLENASPARARNGNVPSAVAFDCEMGYTAFGLELIRLTAVSWPDHSPLLDVLVRPLGTVIDLNSRFSGVWPEHFANAVPYDEWEAKPPSESEAQDILPIVPSPTAARTLLASYLTPSTPLIGHAIENDLNSVRLCHPSIIDTIILYPHPRGLPLRYGLKMLAKKYLERDIQMGGERGHDSLEDAVATGDLVRVRVGRWWREMEGKGWRFNGEGRLVGPPSGFSTGASPRSGVVGTSMSLETSKKGVKRSKEQAGLDGAEDSEAEDEAGNDLTHSKSGAKLGTKSK